MIPKWNYLLASLKNLKPVSTSIEKVHLVPMAVKVVEDVVVIKNSFE